MKYNFYQKYITMKKRITLVAALFFGVASVFAQDETEVLVSKKGTPILPEAGEYSLGIDAAPFFNYVGNMFNSSAANTAPTFNYTANHPFQLTGKYMVDDKTAYRGIFRLGFSSVSESKYVNDDSNTSSTPEFVEDKRTNTQMNVALGAGLEKRRGKGRLQGIYGAQAIILFGTNKNSYEYGNEFSSSNTTPTSYDWTLQTPTNTGTRITENKTGTVFGFQVQAFVGAEYFFAPKFSISGELYYGLGLTSQGDGNDNYEYWDGANNSLKTIETPNGGNFFFGLDSGVNGVLNLNFYF